jgi:hypothetical protein
LLNGATGNITSQIYDVDGISAFICPLTDGYRATVSAMATDYLFSFTNPSNKMVTSSMN